MLKIKTSSRPVSIEKFYVKNQNDLIQNIGPGRVKLVTVLK